MICKIYHILMYYVNDKPIAKFQCLSSPVDGMKSYKKTSHSVLTKQIVNNQEQTNVIARP
jgi:hypothetical protein